MRMNDGGASVKAALSGNWKPTGRHWRTARLHAVKS